MVDLKRNISEFIERYDKVSKLESKLFGEVFTPRQLIDEMLDTLPEDVWKNKDLKWLDPAVGIGNFPAAILDRLMVGLEDSIPNED
jgi:site-specific DNA-methyltransferase (adenine-specific)